jgi:purine-binding chemotaxis protein CheW
MELKSLETLNDEIQEQKERGETVDFKMVTFSLGGKDYGVDIMNVKEIAKDDKFTYVPNAASFVRGVYNLRGDIIPIVDFRIFFNLPIKNKAGADGTIEENMLILKIGDHVFGTIVDKIDKVVGISSDAIQPPHPIFGDINIKYISGVAEKDGDLFIVLDVVRIFTPKDESKNSRQAIAENSPEPIYPTSVGSSAPETVEERKPVISDSALDFVKENLAALKHFTASSINDVWIRRRFLDWSVSRSESNVQVKNDSDAEEFLAPFYSPSTGYFWDDDYSQAVSDILPNFSSKIIQVWNPGCGKGYETFSFACILKSRYPNAQIKIWANDNDIMAISNAPNMVFDLDEIPGFCHSFMVKGSNGYSFNQTIRDAIAFEYHDILHPNTYPELDIILARDMLSFFPNENQEWLLNEFSEKLKKEGVVILGRNEEMPGDNWRKMAKDPVSAYTRK